MNQVVYYITLIALLFEFLSYFSVGCSAPSGIIVTFGTLVMQT